MRWLKIKGARSPIIVVRPIGLQAYSRRAKFYPEQSNGGKEIVPRGGTRNRTRKCRTAYVVTLFSDIHFSDVFIDASCGRHR
jgi:hypothetical protein